MDSLLKDRLTLMAALGAGVVVGISGIYLYYKLNRSVSRELSHLAGTIESLRREIEQLKVSAAASAAPDRRHLPHVEASHHRLNAHPNKQTANTTAGTTSSAEDADEEFYDFTDTEDVLSESWTAMKNGPISVAEEDIIEQSIYDELDKQLDGNGTDKMAAYNALLEKKDELGLGDDPECLWRLAKAAHMLGIIAQKEGNEQKKQQFAFEAHDYAKAALELTNDNPEVHKWYAITVGSLGDYVSTSEKIKNGHTFKKHVDEAIKLKPEDPTLYHMLGRWTYEVASLSWLEKKLANTLYSHVPEASLEDAQKYFLKCHALNPNWKENMLYIAKAYIMQGDYKTAISWIDKSVKIPNHSEDDEISQNELEKLQNLYARYRE